MTTYPDVEEHASHLRQWQHDFVTGGENHTEPGSEHDNYLSYYKVQFGGNSAGWPSHKTINGYTHAWLKGRKQAITGNFANASLQERYYGDFVHATSLPYQGTEGSSWPSREVFMHENRQKVVNQLLDRISDSKVNIAQFIVEREQTKNLVVSTMKRLTGAMMALRKGNIKGAADQLRHNVKGAASQLLGSTFGGSAKSPRGRVGRYVGGIPEQWLALQYGWKPLLSDIDGSCKELASLVTGVEPDTFSATASATTTIDECSYISGGDGGWFPPVKWESTGGSVKGRGSITSKVTVGFLNSASRTGIINPTKLLWEELPYSFVVDWFLPVGSFLDRCSVTDGQTFSKGFISQKCQMPWKAKIHGQPSFTSGWTGSVSGANHTAEFFTFRREALTWFPQPEFPSFKDPFSSTHVANALSLLASAYTGLKHR